MASVISPMGSSVADGMCPREDVKEIIPMAIDDPVFFDISFITAKITNKRNIKSQIRRFPDEVCTYEV